METAVREALAQMPLTQVQVDDLLIDLNTKRVTVKNRLVRLNEIEYAFLEKLALAKGAIVSQTLLMEHALGPGQRRSEEYVKVYICRVRKILAAASGGREYIETFSKRGYLLRPPPP